MRFKKTFIFGSLLLTALSGAVLFAATPASAEYVEHNLIDDNYYLDANSMSQQSIQNFLVARGGYIANYSSYSDADGGNVLASRIIYRAAQDYGINPKVILATLQKEQSLITSVSPSNSQITFAMGYGCPDGGSCSYPGFFNQVDNATWQFRLNFERARGNNSWWNPAITYACGGSTRYYSTGLYPGRSVTFKDDNGTSIRTFTINNPSTASFYCYTPHPYNNPQGLYGNPQFGTTGMYYSGSYNFVRFYELWFGSTQPEVVVTSPLRIETISEGAFTGTKIRVSFDIRNNLSYPMGIGSMAIAVRDDDGGNHDFPLQPVYLPAYGTFTYSAVQEFASEQTYTMWMTNLYSGSWRDNYPASTSIDNPRSLTKFIQAQPTISASPSIGGADMRVGKTVPVSFKIRNNSGQALDIGKVSLALRAQDGMNVDLPLRATGSIAAGAEYTYTESFLPPKTGTYNGFVASTRNNGASWNESTYPGTTNLTQRNVSFTVKQSPTLTQGPMLSVTSPRAGQQVTTSFKVKNYGDQSVDVGRLGLAIRDPLGRNVDAGAVNLVINAGTEYVFNASATFTTPGTYTAWITNTRDGGKTWDDTTYPNAEDANVLRRMTFVVQPSPTVTVAPAVTTVDPRAGKGVSVSFTMHNYGSQAVSVGRIALAARDPHGRNVDFTPQEVTIPAGSDYVYTATNPGTTYQSAGTYTAWITVTRDGGKTWDDTSFPAMESAGMQRQFTFVVKPSPTLTQGPTLSVASPLINQQVTASFKVRNYGDTSVDVGRIGFAIRDPLGRNVDAGAVDLTINADTEYTFQATPMFTTAGTYTAWITVTRDGGKTWDDTSFPTPDSGSVQRKVTFTVQP